MAHGTAHPPSSRVVVAGGGMSGLVAACSALEAGVGVIVLEKTRRLGGSLGLSNGYIVTFENLGEFANAVPDGDPVLHELMVSSFAADTAWLSSLGPALEARRVGGRAGFRTDPAEVIRLLSDRIVRLGGRIASSVALAGLSRSTDGTFTVRLERGESTLEAGAVILATGGLQGNAELLARICQIPAAGLYRRATRGSTGDGVTSALELGAALSGPLDGFYGHAMAAEPALVNEPTYAALTQYQGWDCIALNRAGVRFADESAGAGEEVLNQALARQPDSLGFYLGDGLIAELETPRGSGVSAGSIVERTASLGGIVVRAETIESLCRQLGAFGVSDTRSALATVLDYQDAMRAGRDPHGGPRRANRHPFERPPFWAVKVRSSITFTSGGIAVDRAMRVLAREPSAPSLGSATAGPIDGLFAAGADVGGISGSGYAGGLAAALVSGRRAGSEAAKHVLGRAG